MDEVGERWREAALRGEIEQIVRRAATWRGAVEIRAGALSIDRRESLVGIPSVDIPVPLTQELSTPEIALYKSEAQEGVAKFVAWYLEYYRAKA